MGVSMTLSTDVYSGTEREQATHRQSEPTLTPKRQEVYSALVKAETSLSAYELIGVMKQNYQRQLTPVSIYRMLDFLEQQHLVRKLRSTGKYLAIKHDATHPQLLQFLICRACGHVHELGVDPHVLKELKTCIDNCGYELKNRELELECLCDQCAEKSHPAHEHLRP
jgi:Fur family zinc uptake transcriptional regulator